MSDHHDLAAHLLGIDINEDYDYEAVEDWLAEKFGVDFHAFAGAVDLLLPMTPVLQSPLSRRRYHALGYMDGSAYVAIIKREADGLEAAIAKATEDRA